MTPRQKKNSSDPTEARNRLVATFSQEIENCIAEIQMFASKAINLADVRVDAESNAVILGLIKDFKTLDASYHRHLESLNDDVDFGKMKTIVAAIIGRMKYKKDELIDTMKERLKFRKVKIRKIAPSLGTFTFVFSEGETTKKVLHSFTKKLYRECGMRAAGFRLDI